MVHSEGTERLGAVTCGVATWWNDSRVSGVFFRTGQFGACRLKFALKPLSFDNFLLKQFVNLNQVFCRFVDLHFKGVIFLKHLRNFIGLQVRRDFLLENSVVHQQFRCRLLDAVLDAFGLVKRLFQHCGGRTGGIWWGHETDLRFWNGGNWRG